MYVGKLDTKFDQVNSKAIPPDARSEQRAAVATHSQIRSRVCGRVSQDKRTTKTIAHRSVAPDRWRHSTGELAAATAKRLNETVAFFASTAYLAYVGMMIIGGERRLDLRENDKIDRDTIAPERAKYSTPNNYADCN
ncbi:hypothetical protein GWI33_016991 [Rhynchophorus ferrugineus]|uniref:Uncharacterized protein n=1 Tax=Rhynchophorus ferrugineus TaxID=354439 RepID=A0A834HWD8_RHYFE|nr:hypothetical protein GWI33_016991 [Rhynchophorus ferrugineus]